MRSPSLSLTVTVTAIAASGALGVNAARAQAADLVVTVELPRIPVATYNRPYVAIWIERPDQTAVQTLTVWYKYNYWLKDMRTWWRRDGARLAMPADGVSGPTRAPGSHRIVVPSARLAALAPGQYNIVVETARELGGRELVRVPIRWGAPNTGRASGSTELGTVSVLVTR